MTFVKDPQAELDYVADWTAWLGSAPSGADTIVTSTWVDVTPGITVGTNTNTTTKATVWLSGGTAGTQYNLTNRITTAGGRTNDRTVSVVVREL